MMGSRGSARSRRSSWSARIFPGKRWIEPVILVPSRSPMVLSFGYVVVRRGRLAYSVWAIEMFGGAPWGLYSLTGMAATWA
jgi:ABC-type Fe3+ transport system permease subunit